MKVFWSWQSDHPGLISRHFVREALELAIGNLNQSPDIQEAQRELTLDHDRKGVPGSPDLAATILEKIRASDVFVADVTPVGKTHGEAPKPLINSNVAIELGYALSALGDRRLVMVMNEHYGDRSHLPFDLRHKAGPLMYRLAPNAGRDEIRRAKPELAGVLKNALREMLPTIREPAQSFEPTPSIQGDPSRYFDPHNPLVVRRHFAGRGVEKELHVPTTPLLYLRLMPSKLMPILRRADSADLVRKGPLHLEPFYYHPTSVSFESNEYGAISFDANYEQNEILIAAQLFLNSEIWAFNATLLHPEAHTKRVIPTLSVEQTFATKLPHYLEFAHKKLNVHAPVRIEAGACGVRGYSIGMPDNYMQTEWGPIHQDHILWEGTVASASAESIDRALLSIFEAVFDAGGVRRPPGLHKFPGSTPGALPSR